MKSRIITTVLVVLIFLGAVYSVHAQNTALPDTPSAIQPPTCQNGQPFTTGTLGKLTGSCPFDKQAVAKWDGTPDGFFHFGNGRRALHPDKRSWAIFAAAHAGLWAATAIAVNRHNRSHEEAHSEYPAVVFMTGFDFLMFKTLSPVLGTGPAIYGTVHYSIASTQ
jgi:hypothetical protein